MKIGPRGWSPAEDTLLAKLAEEGKSASAISRAFSADLKLERTRNAIIGRAHRTGINLRGTPLDAAHASARTKRAAKALAKKEKAETMVPTPIVLKKTAKPSPKPAPKQVEVDESKLVGIHQLNSRTCRFPVKETTPRSWLFCGELPMPNGVYCTSHAKVCYQERRKK